MDVSKADLDRAKTKSIKVFPAGKPIAMVSFSGKAEVGWRQQYNCFFDRYSNRQHSYPAETLKARLLCAVVIRKLGHE